MQYRALALLSLVACSKASSPSLDGGGDNIDASRRDSAVEDDAPEELDAGVDATVVDGPPGAYRHAITVDGSDDFLPAEVFTTTSGTAFGARVTWDDERVYVGYKGPDLDANAPGASTKWLFAYVDLDPGGTATGATTAERYNTQAAAFPTGFGAELYFRWKCDGSFTSIQQYANGGWIDAVQPPVTGRLNDFLEVGIPRSLFGNAAEVGIVTFMINEAINAEGTFAGLYQGNFTDGYSMAMPLTKYLHIDFASTASPNSPANARP